MPDTIITTPVGNPAGTPTAPQAPQTPTTPAPAKTFTQEDVDNIVTTRLAKERARYLKKFGVDDESKLDEAAVKVIEHGTIKAELDALKTEKLNRDYKDALGGLNADGEYTDILLSQIDKGKNLDEFKANAKEYLSKHPKFLKENFVPGSSGPALNGGTVASMPDPKTDLNGFLEWRKTHNLDGSLTRK